MHVHVHARVGESSCQQKLFLATFDLGFLDDVSEMVAETSEASKAKVLPVKTTRARARARVAKSAVSENNTCTCACRILQFDQCKKSDFSA